MIEQNLPSIDIVLEEVRRTLDYQFQQARNLDTKSGIVLGTSGIILAILASILHGHSDSLNNINIIRGALCATLLSFLLSFITLNIRKWDRPPEVNRLRSHYIIEDSEQTKLRVIDIYLDAIRRNQRRIKQKIYLVQSSFSILAIASGFFAVWIILLLYE